MGSQSVNVAPLATFHPEDPKLGDESASPRLASCTRGSLFFLLNMSPTVTVMETVTGVSGGVHFDPFIREAYPRGFDFIFSFIFRSWVAVLPRTFMISSVERKTSICCRLASPCD